MTSCNAGFCTLPIAFFGRLCRNTTRRGCLKRARRPCEQPHHARLVQHASRLLDDRRDDDLAPALVGHADDRSLHDLRAVGQHVLELGRVDVLAAGDDHVLRAADDPVEALLVLAREVAGLEPAVCESAALCGVLPVAAHHVGRAHPDLADLPDTTSRPSSPTSRISQWIAGLPAEPTLRIASSARR